MTLQLPALPPFLEHSLKKVTTKGPMSGHIYSPISYIDYEKCIESVINYTHSRQYI
jgi:hypothetical protein